VAAPIDVNALPLILYDDDLCEVLDISRTTLRKLRKHGALPIPELQALDKRHRYSRADVLAYANRQTPLAAVRRRA
jgi:predicted site-specific integrase-resolvase